MIQVHDVCTKTVLLLAIAGCSAEAAQDGGGGAAEDVGFTTQTLTAKGCSVSDYTQFTVSDQIKLGESLETHLCFASRIDGRPTGTGASLMVDQSLANQKWLVQGWGRMTCVPKDCFWAPGINAERAMSSMTSITSANGGCFATADLWWGDAAAIVQGIDSFNAPNGFAMTHFRGASNPSKLEANDGCSNGNVIAWGVSWFVGTAHTNNPVDAFQVTIGGSVTSAVLLAVDRGICYFNEVGKQITSSSRNARIDISNGNWVVRSTGPSGAAPRVTAQCMYFTQQ